tara:strand:- start:33 stop:614 length:582 start_codon:yes stop_codon:yes gene_type:complete
MQNFIEVYDNALSDDDCERIILLSDMYLPTLTEKGRQGLVGNRVVDKNVKDSSDFKLNLDLDDEVNSIVRKGLVSCIERYKNKHRSLDWISEWRYYKDYNIQKYEPGQAFHTLHCENADATSTFSRILAWMFYLNTVTDGGGTYFSSYDLTTDAVQGRCVIWPAYWTHMHKGIVSKTETKYIATGWINFIDSV